MDDFIDRFYTKNTTAFFCFPAIARIAAGFLSGAATG